MRSSPLPSDLRGNLSSVRVLLVEDDPDARDVYSLLLRARGAVVVPVGTVADARLALDAGTFDVLVSDIGLPDENGYDLIAHVRARIPSLRAAAITAFGSAADRARALEAGFEDFLTKPIAAEALWRSVAALAEAAPAPLALATDGLVKRKRTPGEARA